MTVTQAQAVIEKAGARHSLSDRQMLQDIHDHATSLGAECQSELEKGRDVLSIFKDARGQHRWISVSSSSYEDRDGEIVSQKALEDDVARADTSGDYGPLLWWHEPRMPLGHCDFNAMHGRLLVESGTFSDESLGAAFKSIESSEPLEISIAFYHPPSEPDSEGVIHTIRRFERSLLPPGTASNRLTQFSVKGELHHMDEKPKSALEKLIGSELVQKILGRGEQKEKAADAAGLRHKEVGETETTTATVTITATKEGEVGEVVKADDAPPPEGESDKPATIAAMTTDDLRAFILAVLESTVAQTKAELETQKTASETSLKAIGDKADQIGLAVTELAGHVAALVGDLPKGAARGYRPEKDSATVLSAERVKALGGPSPDAEVARSVNEFLSFAVSGGNGTHAPSGN